MTEANRPSLVRSLVGLVERPPGTASLRPPASPAMILVTAVPRPGRQDSSERSRVTSSGLLKEFGSLGVEQGADRGCQGGLPGQRGVGADKLGGFLPGGANQLLVSEQPQ